MFDFDDINLIPNKCIVNSRSECDTSIKIGPRSFDLPIMPANMEAVIDEDVAIKLALHNQFYVMHRFNVNNIQFINMMHEARLFASISIGINDKDFELIRTLKASNISPEYITIDIAHGHSVKMEQMLKTIKDVGLDSYLIAGNVASPEAVYDLQDWGADGIKVGIGPGSACTTWNATGFGSRNKQAYFIKECSAAIKANKMLIADGGIKHHGDIAKALTLGADLVMIGGMLSGFADSPGAVVEHDNKKFKEFWGSASEFQSNKKSRIEGKKYLVELKNRSILHEYTSIKESLQSAISYAGGKDLSSFLLVKYV